MTNRHVQTHTAKSAANDVGTGAIDTQGATCATLYVRSGTGVTSGAVQLESSPTMGTNDWAAIGSPLTVPAAGAVAYQAAIKDEAHRYLRARISTVVAGGTIDVWITTAGFAGSFEDR